MLESCLLSERQESLSGLLAIKMQGILLACYKLPERQALWRPEAGRKLELAIWNTQFGTQRSILWRNALKVSVVLAFQLFLAALVPYS